MIKKETPVFAFFGCVLLFAPLLLLAGSAKAENDTILRPQPLVFEIGVEEVAILSIFIEDAAQVFAIDVSGTFDPDALEVVDANAVYSGIQLIPGSIPKPDFPVVNTADNDLGTFHYAVVEMSPSEPMSGSGTVFSIKLRGETAGETALTISSVTLSDKEGLRLPVTPQNGSIHVLSEPVYQDLYLPLVRK